MQAVQQCLEKLLQGQRNVTSERQKKISPSLVLADALLRYQQALSKCRDTPVKNIVVIGPTQAGKSSVVNWLLGKEVALVNSLAGFTRHAQGFALTQVSTDMENSLADFFNDWEKLDQDKLSDQELEAWSLESVTSSKSDFENTIIWDTPDFDSVSSRAYRHVAMKMLAIADVVVFVLSKEKYADQTVWHTLKTIAPVKIPLLICLNKTSQVAAQEILPELDRRLQKANLQAAVITIPYLDDMSTVTEYAQKLQYRAKELLAKNSTRDRGEIVKTLAKINWDQWSLPAYVENRQQVKWQELITQACTIACQQYEDTYLQGSAYEATLQKAMVRLLELLELPGIAKPLVQARQLLTWPARKIRGMFTNRKAILEKSDTEKLDVEREILNEIIHQLILSLQNTVGKNIASEQVQDNQWWVNLFNAIEEQTRDITESFDKRVKQYQQEFSVEIEAAAQKLYEHLKENPAKLNSLRAARVTTDAAAVVFALKTGGIGLSDLVLTPAMLSFVSMLTEGALGKYMQGVQKRLKQSQKESVCHGLIQEKLSSRFKKIEAQMSKKGLYNISQSTLTEVEKALGA